MKDDKYSPRKHSFLTGFIAALAAGAIATGIMLLLSVTFDGVSLPETFGSDLTALMPPPLFDYLHQIIGGDAKHYLFYGIIVGQCLVFALSGGLYNWLSDRQNRVLQWFDGFLLALILWLFAGVILLPLSGAGVFGADLSIGLSNGLVSLAIVGIVFGSLFVIFQHWLSARMSSQNVALSSIDSLDQDFSPGALSRRTLLRNGVIATGIVLAGVVAWRFITGGTSSSNVSVNQLLSKFKSKIVPPPTPNYGAIEPAQFLSPEVTSNDQFYLVSKNLFSDPKVNGNSWRLTVDGQVEHSLQLTYQELLAQPMKKQYESLMCISNNVGGQYMSNALWEGIPLVDLLQRAGVKAGATKIVFHAADDYTDTIHLTKALEPTTLLAMHMNGQTLPQEHGFPARMLVPGIYGMKHCKWLTRIEVVNYDYKGYWQQRGWSDAAPVRMTSRIDTPLTGSTIKANQTTYIAGVAFSGNKGISEVDVSTDAGQNWQRAILKQPLSSFTWVLWELAWQPPKTGSYTVVARAIDLEGNVQIPNEEPPLPNGSSGYHSIILNVS
ncbi:MAG TPA: molybdopterin-dependent oxidoreductase [Ktedonobacteraceae bacterium]|nr:molybdopterin-dependent oxidoreductase [Ktedonobacteraceae bacterium]